MGRSKKGIYLYIHILELSAALRAASILPETDPKTDPKPTSTQNLPKTDPKSTNNQSKTIPETTHNRPKTEPEPTQNRPTADNIILFLYDNIGPLYYYIIIQYELNNTTYYNIII